MAYKIKKMDPDALICEREGVKVYAKELREEYPLYREVKMITTAPWFMSRRTAHFVWIVHQKRLRKGGDGWRLCQVRPDLYDWITAECALSFDPRYVQDTIGCSEAEYQALVEAENKKYKK